MTMVVGMSTLQDSNQDSSQERLHSGRLHPYVVSGLACRQILYNVLL